MTWETISIHTLDGVGPQTRKGRSVTLSGVRYFLTLGPRGSVVQLTHYASGKRVDEEDLALGRSTPQQLLDRVVRRVGADKFNAVISAQPILNK